MNYSILEWTKFFINDRKTVELLFGCFFIQKNNVNLLNAKTEKVCYFEKEHFNGENQYSYGNKGH